MSREKKARSNQLRIPDRPVRRGSATYRTLELIAQEVAARLRDKSRGGQPRKR